MAKNQQPRKVFKKILWGMSVHQKLDIILESKVVQKLSLEKQCFAKKWSPKLIFFLKKFSWFLTLNIDCGKRTDINKPVIFVVAVIDADIMSSQLLSDWIVMLMLCKIMKQL